jgi:hypothetical protein
MLEMKTRFAVIIHVCFVKKPLLCDYWTMGPILHTNYATRVGISPG